MTVTDTLDSGEVRRSTPRALCQECGDDTVVAVCCNCLAFLCGVHYRLADLDEARRKANSLLRRGIYRHRGPEPPEPLDRIPDPVEVPGDQSPDDAPKQPDEQPPSEEGPRGQPGHPPRHVSADEAPAEPKSARRRYFCAECVPVGYLFDIHVIAAVITTLIGLAVASVFGIVGVVLAIGSLTWLGVRIGIGLVRRRRRGCLNRRLLFLVPRIRKLELTETMEGRCELDNARKESLVVDTVEGNIDVGLRWTGNHATSAELHRKRARADRRAVLRAEAGHLVLRGVGQMDLKHPAGCEITHAARVSLRPHLADHEILSHADGHGDARWDFMLTYVPEQPSAGWRLPVWVTPSFTPDSERRALDLRVQWRTTNPISDPDDGPALTAKELTSVVLEVPGSWGTIRQATLDDVEQTLVGRAEDGSTRIEWKKPTIAKTERGFRDLSVSFSRPVEPSATVRGEVEIAFAEAVSGINAVQMHAPGGGRRRDGVRPKIKTKIRVRFALSLAGIQHQESRTVPDVAFDLDETETRTFPDTRPDPMPLS